MAEAGGRKSYCKKTKLKCSYAKDHMHMTEHRKTLKQSLERLVSKGHLVEYIKGAKKAKNRDSDEEEEEPSRGLQID